MNQRKEKKRLQKLEPILGDWMYENIQQWRKGELEQWKIDMLEEIEPIEEIAKHYPEEIDKINNG